MSSVRVEFDRVCCEYPPYFKPQIYQAVDSGPLHLDIWQSVLVYSRNIAHASCYVINNTEEPLSGLGLNCQLCPGICHGASAPVSSELCRLLLHLLHVAIQVLCFWTPTGAPSLVSFAVFYLLGTFVHCLYLFWKFQRFTVHIVMRFAFDFALVLYIVIYLGYIFHISPVTLCDTKKLWWRY